MKAKDWATHFQTNPSEALSNYLKETLELFKKRGSSDTAIEGAIREQINKYHAIVKLVPDLERDWFEVLLEETNPNQYQLYVKTWYKQKEKIHRKYANQRYQQAKKEIDNETDPQVRLGLLIAAIFEKMDSQKEFEETYKPLVVPYPIPNKGD